MKILNRILKQIELSRVLKLKQYLYYRIQKNKVLKLSVYGKDIWIRKRTPDLYVAISCFGGEFDLLRHLFPKDYSGIIVDAGGYIGTAAIVFSEMYPKAKIITIEPSLDNFNILQRNIAKYKNIKAIHGALSASDIPTATLHNRNTGEWGFTLIKNPKDHPEAHEICEVPVFRLSTLGVNIEDIGILKLDIEGGEHAIMTYDYEDLELIPAIVIELHNRIIEGCTELFFSFSKNRIVIKDNGEKYLSLKKEFN